jgi:hypothetical protein
MGLFPFASTVGTMWHSRWPDALAPSGPVLRRIPLRSPFGWFRPSFSFASCLRTARCPDAVARPAGIHGGVSRRTSGQTLSRSEHGDRAMAERSPPSSLRPPC